jgi:hypothetical protein
MGKNRNGGICPHEEDRIKAIHSQGHENYHGQDS